MKFTAEHYFRASLERIRQAHALYRQAESYSLTMYTAGVAVECMLRAFKLLRDPSFDEKHDLPRLFKASGMLNVDQIKLRANGLSNGEAENYARELQVSLNEVCLLWSNDFRYASEHRLRAHLKRHLELPKRANGDLLKGSALQPLRAAQKFVDKGFLLWTASGRK